MTKSLLAHFAFAITYKWTYRSILSEQVLEPMGKVNFYYRRNWYKNVVKS